jgi:pimeloyl-ACP methyl ester carboxylesterase
LSVLKRLLLALLAFSATSAALFLVTSQLLPGWRPPGVLPSLDPRRVQPSGRHEAYEVRQTSAEITVDDSANLAAWILRPAMPGDAEPVPGVVLVHGAGHGSRESLLEMGRALASAGTAVIIYDKRTAGYSVLTRDYAALAEDAIRAADVLQTAHGVDRDRIGILGFSEGGWVAPTAVNAAPQRFAFLVLASAPVVTPLEQASWIVDQQFTGTPEALRKAAATALASGRTLINYLDFDVSSTLAALDLPVYSIWGADDSTVPINVAARRLSDALPGGITVRILPKADHQLPSDTGWEADLAVWIVSTPQLQTDDISGVEPASAAGVSRLPASRWYLNPILHGIVSGGVAILVFVITGQRARQSSTSTSGRQADGS